MPIEKLSKILKENAELPITLCRELIKRPSEDPPGDTRAVAVYIQDFLASHGIAAELVSPHQEKPNVVATIEGARPGKHVVYNGHIDTYPVGDRERWSYDPFGATLENGRIYGRGACDMKGGVAASLVALLALNRIRDSFPGKVSITCVSDEEVYGPWGSRHILEAIPALRGDALINGEPSSLEHVRIGEKGKLFCTVTTRTKGGHGAYARLRESAVTVMWDLLSRIKAFEEIVFTMPPDIAATMARSRVSYDNILGPGTMDAAIVPSVNVGTIQGGIMDNMVPEKCEAELDIRIPPGLTGQDVRAFLDGVMAAVPYEAEWRERRCEEPYLTAPGHPLIRIAHAAAQKAYGMPVYENYSLGATEAYLWRARGIPAVVYGPGHHNMASPDEYVIADELPKVAEVHALTALGYLLEPSA